MEYKAVTFFGPPSYNTRREFNRKVNEMLEKGYELAGDMSIAFAGEGKQNAQNREIVMAQPLVKKEQ